MAFFAMFGLCTEIFFTAVKTAWKGRDGRIDLRLIGQTSAWNVLVYGLSSAASFRLADAAPGLYARDPLTLGLIAMGIICAWEAVWGFALERLIGACPWQYEYRRFKRILSMRIFRYVNPWYAPFWFAYGLALVRLHLWLAPLLRKAFA